MALVDPYGRKIDYLRISVTDHCNLNCRYCSPPFSGRTRLYKSEILSYEELQRLAEVAIVAGITKIRITGGEPLVRKGIVDFCRMLSGIKQLKSLAITTNGILLGEMAVPLYRAGVQRINVSLDTLKPERFFRITGKDSLHLVLDGIERAEAAGFNPVKLNTVVMRGINDDELEALSAITFSKPYHVRFIELMPLQKANNRDFKDRFVPVGEMIRHINWLDHDRVEPTLDNQGPARLCTLHGARGRIGFIAPMSWHLCGSCNRLRLTADGKIRPCLFSNHEIDVKTPLRAGASKKELFGILQTAVSSKPRQRALNGHTHQLNGSRAMYAIGG